MSDYLKELRKGGEIVLDPEKGWIPLEKAWSDEARAASAAARNHGYNQDKSYKPREGGRSVQIQKLDHPSGSAVYVSNSGWTHISGTAGTQLKGGITSSELGSHLEKVHGKPLQKAASPARDGHDANETGPAHEALLKNGYKMKENKDNTTTYEHSYDGLIHVDNVNGQWVHEKDSQVIEKGKSHDDLKKYMEKKQGNPY